MKTIILIAIFLAASQAFLLRPSSYDTSALDAKESHNWFGGKLHYRKAFNTILSNVLTALNIKAPAQAGTCFSDAEVTYQVQYLISWSNSMFATHKSATLESSKKFLTDIGRKMLSWEIGRAHV